MSEETASGISMSEGNLIFEQQSDPGLTQLFNQTRAGDSADNITNSYYIKNDVLIRTWKSSQIPNSEN